VLVTRADRRFTGFALALALAAALAFYVPALRATGGDWPAPLDDVFIHYDFARATAQGHPFEWIAGQGYSSGETAPLYPFLLAIGYLVGFRGLWLGVWAAALAVASLVLMMRGLRTLMKPAPEGLAWIAAIVLVGFGVLDWSWFSGMETAVLGAALVQGLVATQHARGAAPTARARAQWIVGAWGATLVLLRPEASVVVLAMGVVVARRAGSGSALAALARSGTPAAAALGAVLLANRVLTGDAQSAGALLKLLSENPYLSDVDRALALVENLALVRWKVLEAGLSARAGLWPLLPSLAVVALFARRTRALASVCLSGALGWTLLAAWNGASRYQNFRYFMPPLALVLVTAGLGLSALGRSRRGAIAGCLFACAALIAGAPRMGWQIRFFRDASTNVHDQQVEVGRRLARIMAPDASVLVGDAGAIAYVSARHAIDALGLGGYHRLPFVRAAVLGEAATVELIERLPPDERPAYLALYPNWFGGITGRFGREITRVTIDHNVICGGPTKVIYRADWTALGRVDEPPSGAEVDALDTGDVISEAEHGYVSCAPFGGWTMLDVRIDSAGTARFDAGRITPEGRSERFLAAHGTDGPAVLRMRTDGEPSVVDVSIGDGAPVALGEGSVEGSGRWTLRSAGLAAGVHAGDAVVFTVRRGTLHDFHVWIGRQDAPD
jgi:hypothetical protein